MLYGDKKPWEQNRTGGVSMTSQVELIKARARNDLADAAGPRVLVKADAGSGVKDSECDARLAAAGRTPAAGPILADAR